METDDETERSTRELFINRDRSVEGNLLLRTNFAVELSSCELNKNMLIYFSKMSGKKQELKGSMTHVLEMEVEILMVTERGLSVFYSEILVSSVLESKKELNRFAGEHFCNDNIYLFF